MELQYTHKKDRLYVPMPDELDHHAAKQIGREIDFLVDAWQIRTVVFDFARTQFMDSSGIGVMIGRKRAMEMRQGTVAAVHLGERVQRIFERAGLFRIIPVIEEEA